MPKAVPKKVQKALSKRHACYVLITCEEPTEDGTMQVEMTYEGDATVASYLLQGAQSFLDDKEEKPASSPKVHYL